MADLRSCSIEGCDKPLSARGWCLMHYSRWRTHDNPLVRKTVANGEARAFFEQVVLPYDDDECLIWPFARAAKGYGFLRSEGKQNHVHRLVCREVNGPPPTPKHHAAHSCGNGRLGCVTPKHLSWKTAKENIGDCFIHGTRIRGKWSRPNRQRRKKEAVYG